MQWYPFHRAEFIPLTDTKIRELAVHMGVSEEEFRAKAEAERAATLVFMNNIYQAQVRKIAPKLNDDGTVQWPEMIYLSIKRLDKEPIGKTKYRDFMRIKDELVGPEYEAVELYPARSREVDEANQYHLWCLSSSEVRFPFGFQERHITENNVGGSRQAAFKPEHRKVLEGSHYGRQQEG